jgi:alkaline phosphatase D
MIWRIGAMNSRTRVSTPVWGWHRVLIGRRSDGAKNVRDVAMKSVVSGLCRRSMGFFFALVTSLTLVVGSFNSAAYAQTLTLGPVTGGVDANNARVFIRTSAAATAIVEYGTDPALGNPSFSWAVSTSGTHDFTSTVQLSSLTPLSTYYLNVLVNGVAQLTPPYPSFTTFPTPGASTNFKFIVLTDFYSHKDLTSVSPSFGNAAAENPAFAFIGGDFDHSGPTDVFLSRAMFKALYNAHTKGMSDFVNLILRKMPIAHQWDDHDSGPNNVDKRYVNWSTDYQVYNEYVPAYNLAGPPSSLGIWQKFTYGQADFFILDCRSQRDNEYLVDNVNKSMLDGRHLGVAGELTWLENSLLTSTAKWKIVFSSVSTNPTEKFADNWAGFQSEWSRLRTFIQQNGIKNVFFISGDVHMGGIDSGAASGFPEMLVGNVNIDTPTGLSCSTGNIGNYDQGLYYNLTGSCQQYGVVTFTTNPDQVLLQVKDSLGNVKISYTLNAS